MTIRASRAVAPVLPGAVTLTARVTLGPRCQVAGRLKRWSMNQLAGPRTALTRRPLRNLPVATSWNSKRIAAEMDRRQIYRVGHRYIDDLRLCPRQRPTTTGTSLRTHSTQRALACDIKGPFFINLGGRSYIKTWIVGLIDDHSRFVIGLRILPEPKPPRS